MKLHLPKSLFVAVTAAMVAISQSAMGVTYDTLLSDATLWETGCRSGKITIANNTCSTTNTWGQMHATTELQSILGADENTALTFSVTINAGDNYDQSFGIGLIGTENVLVVGTPYKINDVATQQLAYGISTDVTATAFPFTGKENESGWGGSKISPSNATFLSPSEGVTLTYTHGTPFTIAGSYSGNTLTLTYTSGETSRTMTYDMTGTTLDIAKISLFCDGGTSTFTNLSVGGAVMTQELVWNGAAGNNTWSATSLAGGAATTELSNVTFAELAEGISNTVVIDGSVTAHDITINDDYTFQSAGTATLNASKITIADGKTLTYSGTGDLTIGCDITGDVSISGGTLNSGKITGDVTVTGGELNVSGSNAINGNLSITNGTVNASVANGNTGSVITAGKTISIYEGGTLNLSGHDMLKWESGAPASILLKGKEGEGNMATLNIDETSGSCTMTTMFDMQGYSQVTGSSFNSYAENDNTIEGDIKTKAGVLVSGTNNKIATDEVQIRANWVVDVTTGGELEVSSVIKDGNNDKGGKLVKKGEGTLTLSGTNTQTRGTIIEDGTIIADNDKAMGDAGVTINKGTLQVGVGEADSKDVNLTITGGLSLTQKSDANKVALSEGSSLTLGDIKFTGSKNDGSIVRVEDGPNTAAYSAGNASYSVSNATVTVSGSSDVSISNRLIDVALVNNSTGQVTATNGYNNLTAIEAVNGNIHVKGQQGQQGQTYHDLSALTVGAGKTVGIHTKWNEVSSITDTANQATVTVAGTATFGEGANLYAGLTLADGASLTLDGALTMHGGTLTLGSNITLDSTTLASITGLADGDTTVTLFTGVGNLTLSGPALQSETEQYTLNQIFAGEGLENFYLSYKDGEVYAGKVVVAPTPGIPEPATATLSLLALCGLAARRRRA